MFQRIKRWSKTWGPVVVLVLCIVAAVAIVGA